MRKLLSAASACLLFCALVALAQGPPTPAPQGKGKAAAKGGGESGSKGGFVPKNLQVLNAATFPDAMQSFVAALGLETQGRCTYCHVEDRSWTTSRRR